MEKQTVTIYDVAREAEVSMATVSRVVNGNANVKASTKERVEAVIKQLGYRPNAVARGLASRRTTTVGLLIPNLTDQYFAELARGIEDVAQMYKYQIILASSDDTHTSHADEIDNLLGKQVDGLIIMGNYLAEGVQKQLFDADMPVVLAGLMDAEGTVPSVNIDYRSAFLAATQNLLSHGHKRIAFITGSLEHPINREYKLKGYQDALAEAGITYDPALVFETDYDYEDGYALVGDIQKAQATAGLVVDDEMAAGVLNGLTDAGVSVPHDFELVTSNNSKLTELTRPQMSSITQPVYDIGAVSMRMLTKLMDQTPLTVKQIQLPHGYESRATTN